VLLKINAGTLTVIQFVALLILFLLLLLSTLPTAPNEPPLLVLSSWGIGLLVLSLIIDVVIGGLVIYHYSGPHQDVTLWAISDRTCYKCGKTVLEVTSRDIAIQNAKARLAAHQKNAKEVNDQVWKSEGN